MKRLVSNRLGYKRIREDSYSFLMSYLSRSDTTKYLPRGRPYSKDEVEVYIRERMRHWQQHDFGIHLIYLKATDECIGYCGLEYVNNSGFVDLRYGLVVKHWGKGFAKEAVLQCIEFGFDTLQLDAIYGVAVPDNIASIAVMLKAGMRQVDDVQFYGDSVKYYQIGRENWLSSGDD